VFSYSCFSFSLSSSVYLFLIHVVNLAVLGVKMYGRLVIASGDRNIGTGDWLSILRSVVGSSSYVSVSFGHVQRRHSGGPHPANLIWRQLRLSLRIVGDGVQTGFTRHRGHLLSYFACPGWLWGWRIIRWNEDWQGKPKYSEKTSPGATLSTTNPTWPDPGLNPGRHCGKPAINRLSYGAAYEDS
jgi:hypothetical protein